MVMMLIWSTEPGKVHTNGLGKSTDVHRKEVCRTCTGLRLEFKLHSNTNSEHYYAILIQSINRLVVDILVRSTRILNNQEEKNIMSPAALLHRRII
jgi:hypothetical protein